MTASAKPNIVLVLNGAMGDSDIGCYGDEIETPNLDRLAANGLRFSQFCNTARCSPSRALMSIGQHPHQIGVGLVTYDAGPEGCGVLDRDKVGALTRSQGVTKAF